MQFKFSNDNFHILEIQNDVCFEFYLLDFQRSKAWSNTIMYDDLKTFSKDFTSHGIYIETLHKILTGKAVLNKYTFILKDNTFYIEEIIHNEENIKKCICHFQVKEKDFNLLAVKFIKHHNKCNIKLQEEIEEKSNEIQRILTDKVQYQIELFNCKEEHNKIVDDMMKSFLVLLNSKKNRIVQLYDIIEDLKQLESVTPIKVDENIADNTSKLTEATCANEPNNILLKNDCELEERKVDTETTITNTNSIQLRNQNVTNALLYENKKPNTCDLLLDDDEPKIKRNKIVEASITSSPQTKEENIVLPSSLDFDAEKFLDEL